MKKSDKIVESDTMIYKFSLPIGGEEISRFIGLLPSRNVVSEFETKFRSEFGAEYSHATYKGRTAIYLILKSLNLKRGDEVLVPSFVCEVVIKAILRASLKPRLVDIDPDTYTLDIDSLNDAITLKTKALMAVHTYGQPCNMGSIMEIAKDHDIYTIEDCAQAVGAEYGKQAVGTIGDVSMFSFNIDKIMTTGFGGMILTKNRDVEDRINKNLKLLDKCNRMDNLRVRKRFLQCILYSKPNLYSKIHKLNPEVENTPYKPTVSEKGIISLESYIKEMSPISASIGLIQLQKLDQMNEKRRQNAELLSRGIKGLDFLELPKVIEDVKHIYHTYTVKVKGENPQEDRIRIMQNLNNSGIEAINYVWAFAIHQVPYYREVLKIKDEKFPGTDRVVKGLINLPTHPLLTEKNVNHIINSLSSIDL